MISKKIFLILLVSFRFLVANAQYDYIENTKVFEENKIPARATFSIAESKGDLAVPFLKRDNYLSLNGIWKFNHSNTPEERILDFYTPEFSSANWKDIPVPSDWQLYGYDYPIYTNWKYSFKPNRPNIPRDFNPVGQYQRKFNLPENWELTKESGDVLLHFGAVNSAFFVWINGHYVGYSQDSKLPSEFSVSDYLQKGENTISVEVYRYSDGSYLEDQDFWRLSGIERDVYLYKTPAQSVFDYTITSTLDSSYTNGLFAMKLLASKGKDITVKLELRDNKDSIVLQRFANADSNVDDEEYYHFKGIIENVKTWSAAKPNLYTLTIELKNNDETIEVIEQKVGFKKLEIKDGIFYINGEYALIKGVNRHEHDANWGHCVADAENATNMQDLRKDLQMIKDFGFNAIRTAHYPNHPEFYNICDELGLYVCDEANIEAHWYMMFSVWNNLAMDKDFKAPILSRIKNMYERDKNHASIIMWSVANETGTGETMVEAYRMLKKLDPERPVFNERHFFINTIKEKHSDFNGNMYAKTEVVKNIIKKDHDRPFIWIEYAHAMGNSTGNFKDLWEFIKKEPQVQGGFIWDWRDQGIWKTNENGEKFLAYGGHFEPEGVHNDGNFCANGLISADGKPHPGLYEARAINYSYQFELLEGNRLKITNSGHNYPKESLFVKITSINNHGGGNGLSLKGYEKYLPEKDTIIPLDFIQEHLAHFTIWVGVKSQFLNAEVADKNNKREVLLGLKQFIINNETHIHGSDLSGASELKFVEADDEFVVSTDSFEVHISKKGKLTQYSFRGKEIVKDFGLNFWRTPTDNDFGNGMQKRCKKWRETTLKQDFKGAKLISKTKEQVVIKGYFKLAFNKKAEILYTINNKAELKLDISAQLNGSAEIPRVGSYLLVDTSERLIQYYGNGPYENYNDRKDGVYIHRHYLDAMKQEFPYIRPQEYGNRTDCFSLVSKNIKIESEQLFSFSAWNHSLWDIEEFPQKQGKTSLDIPKRDYVWMNIDFGQTGVGGDNSWGRKPYEKYMLRAGKYSWSYTISPKF